MKKKFSQRSSTTQRDADRERERVNKMGDDIREEIAQLVREAVSYTHLTLPTTTLG